MGFYRRRSRRKKPQVGATSPREHSDATQCTHVLNTHVGAERGDWYAIPNETLTRSEAIKRKQEGLKAGASDYCIVRPPPALGWDIRAVYIELKRVDGKGVESRKQAEFGAGVERHGCLYFVVNGWRELRALVIELGYHPMSAHTYEKEHK